MFILASVQAFNKRQVGFLFCIMSGTSVRGLHDVLNASRREIAPFDIPLPLLGVDHMTEILLDLATRCGGKQ